MSKVEQSDIEKTEKDTATPASPPKPTKARTKSGESSDGWVDEIVAQMNNDELTAADRAVLAKRNSSAATPSKAGSTVEDDDNLPNASLHGMNPSANVYIANLPEDFTVEQLREKFDRFGPIVRCAVKSSGNPRSYAFVQYNKEENALRAIKEMNGTDVGNGFLMNVSIALTPRGKAVRDNLGVATNVYIRGLPVDFRKTDLDRLFEKFGEIVQSRVVGVGVGFVRYLSHESALASIEHMNGVKPPNGLETDRLVVKFANPPVQKPKLPQIDMNGRINGDPNDNYNNLYVRGLPEGMSLIELEAIFSQFGPLTATKLIGNGVGLIRYEEPAGALLAIQQMNGAVLADGGEPMLVKLANNDPARTDPTFHSNASMTPSPSPDMQMPYHPLQLPSFPETPVSMRGMPPMDYGYGMPMTPMYGGAMGPASPQVNSLPPPMVQNGMSPMMHPQQPLYMYPASAHMFDHIGSPSFGPMSSGTVTPSDMSTPMRGRTPEPMLAEQMEKMSLGSRIAPSWEDPRTGELMVPVKSSPAAPMEGIPPPPGLSKSS
eukprot:212932_1